MRYDGPTLILEKTSRHQVTVVRDQHRDLDNREVRRYAALATSKKLPHFELKLSDPIVRLNSPASNGRIQTGNGHVQASCAFASSGLAMSDVHSSKKGNGQKLTIELDLI